MIYSRCHQQLYKNILRKDLGDVKYQMKKKVYEKISTISIQMCQ